VIEFTASMQARKDKFDAWDFFFRMYVDRHAATVIDDFQRTVLEQGHLNFIAVSLKRFVNTVIDNFVSEMIGPSRIGIHTGPAPDRLQPAKDLNVCRVVTFSH
jgi:hypothetical protein